MKKIKYSLPVLLMTVTLVFAQCKTHKQTANTGSQHTGSQHTAAAQPVESANASITINPETAMAEDALEGKWEFDYFTYVNTNKKILFPTQFPQLTFDTRKKTFSGTAGCNNISGEYIQKGDHLVFNQPMIMTRMSCNAMGEKSFVNYLIAVTKFNIVENSLQLIDDLKPVIVMKKVQQ